MTGPKNDTETRPEVEILVHRSAPATAAADARYRALAAAYLAFEPARRTLVYSTAEHHAQLAETEEPIPKADSIPSSVQEHREAECIPSSVPQPAVLSSPQCSFEGASDNLASPRLRVTEVETNTQDSLSSWKTPPSVIPDSFPENNLTILEYCSPTRILEHYLRGLGSSESNSVGGEEVDRPLNGVQESAQKPIAELPSTINDSWVRSRSDKLAVASTELPQVDAPDFNGLPVSSLPSIEYDSWVVEAVDRSQQKEMRPTVISLSPTVNLKRRRPDGAPVSTPQEYIKSTYPYPRDTYDAEVGTSSRADSEPPPLKRFRPSPGPPDAGKPLTRSTSDIGPRHNEKQRKLEQDPSSQISQDELSTEIIAPDPMTSTSGLCEADMVTEAMKQAANDLKLEKRFRPKSQTRELRPFERGYWLVDSTSWSDELKKTAWRFLTTYVGEGCAGWGVNCRRDPTFTWIRLYSFGCVVGHMWLLLYLASNRETNFTGMTWISGNGKPIIAMEPKPRRK
ncbi:hypothetical protein B0H63DRAFT_485047 [Podospora didyma]|uniref:Uncharacterized protein n=1 Tax=Podospora didyma TaxID=330526 RepID=A0AAE0N6E4_9PEZI|nr:hypothetical protein B0H63DRAFT_485047 [Podospora didyma]